MSKKFPIDLLGDLIAVKPASPAKGKILLPDWQRSLEGDVIARGPDARDVKKGDRVLFGAATGMESVFDGYSIRLMRETDVLGVVE